ncbi:MAG TPA: hypothetical protein VI958_10705, partial [Acidobacteriota bacterium]
MTSEKAIAESHYAERVFLDTLATFGAYAPKTSTAFRALTVAERWRRHDMEGQAMRKAILIICTCTRPRLSTCDLD